MKPNAPQDTAPSAIRTDAGEMSRYGITRVPVDYFHLGEFRYTSLTDAIAEARRRDDPGPRSPSAQT